jgi:endonuclease/exonuclease/phosphatase family metal-dependent hydrolase
MVMGDHRVRIVCAHLGLRRHERREQIRRLLIALDGHQQDVLVFAGDINEWFPFSRNLKTLKARFKKKHPVRFTFPSLLPWLALDRIWVDSHRPYRVHLKKETSWQTRIASDHLPLWAEMTLT